LGTAGGRHLVDHEGNPAQVVIQAVPQIIIAANIIMKKNLMIDRKFQKVQKTPASFAFFVAIHDFIECIELDAVLASNLSPKIKINKELDIATKYGYLKQIYQGLEDAHRKTDNDLGHDRYMVVRDLSRIQNKETTDSISFWKKRELFRKLAGEIYERLNGEPVGVGTGK
jgi:hypothetical protein